MIMGNPFGLVDEGDGQTTTPQMFGLEPNKFYEEYSRK